MIVLRSDILSSTCAKLHTVAASNNRSSYAMITLLLLVRATYMNGVVLHAHPIRGESHIQRNTTGEVAAIVSEKPRSQVSC